MNNIFGAPNITRWADVEGNRDEAEISARIDWAIQTASEFAYSKLRRLTYPIDDVVVHSLVIHNTANKAADLLYGPRAIQDTADPSKDLMESHRKEYMMFFTDIEANRVDLGIDRQCRPYPAVVKG